MSIDKCTACADAEGYCPKHAPETHQPVELPPEGEKLKGILQAHLDGVYVFSARKNCDELVTALILAYQHRIRKSEVLKNVMRFADGRCQPEVQAAIDANKSIIECPKSDASDDGKLASVVASAASLVGDKNAAITGLQEEMESSLLNYMGLKTARLAIHALRPYLATPERESMAIEALREIYECAHGIMPVHDNMNNLMSLIVSLDDARWTRLYAIYAGAKAALSKIEDAKP